MASLLKFSAIALLITTLLAQDPSTKLTKLVTSAMEERMKFAIRELVNASIDSDGMRFMIPGIPRAIFHDCVSGCDGCIDMRRRVQPNNNGISPTWKPLRSLWRKVFLNDVSFADFVAVATVVATEMAAEEAENVGECTATEGLGDFNDCKPVIPMVWGRRTCEHAQKVEEFRPLPNADADPYEFHKDIFDMDERTTICLMGGHTLGKMRSNETGFNGTFTSRPESLDSEYYKIMLDQENQQWNQKLVEAEIDGESALRRQWMTHDKQFVMLNSDMRLAYKFRPTTRSKVKCHLPPKTKKSGRTCAKLDSAQDFMRQLAENNKMFVNCYANAIAKLIRVGYEEGELVATGQPIPTTTTTTTTTRAPRIRPRTTEATTKKPKKKNRRRRRNRFGNRKESRDILNFDQF